MIAKLIHWCVDNRAMVLVLSTCLIVAGVWSARHITVDAIPDLSDVQVVIRTEYPGRAPQIVEDQVTYPLTTAMMAVPRAKVVRGQSMFGSSFVFVIFDDGTDMYWARSRVLEQLSAVSARLPDGVTPQLGPDATAVGWVYQYALLTGRYCEDHPNGADGHPRIFTHGETTCPITGKPLKDPQVDLAELRSLQDWYLRYELTAVNGVSEVAPIGGFVKQYQVVVDPRKLLAFEISIDDVRRAVERSNRDAGGRLIEMSETEYMVRGRGYLGSTGDKDVLADLRRVALGASPDGSPIYLESVAEVRAGPEIRRGVAEWNGEGETVAAVVVMRYGENARDTIDRIKARLAELEGGLPPGVGIATAYDRADLIERAVATVRHTLIEEVLVVSLVIVLFLLHVRSALVAAFVLPAGVLATLAVMYVLDINANIMSLGGIAISIGVMVDSSIVMVENAHKHLERAAPDAPRARVIADAAAEVGPTLFFSLLIITVSFLPIFVLGEESGRLFKPLAYTKTFAMAAAAVLAVTVIPVLMVLFIHPRQSGKRRVSDWLLLRQNILQEDRNPISRLLQAIYNPAFAFVMKFRWPVLIAAALVFALTWVPFSRLGSEFMPPLEEGDILYMPTTDPGVSMTKARELLQQTDRIIKSFPEVDAVLGKIGRADTATDVAPPSMLETTITLHRDKSKWRTVGDRPITVDELIYGYELNGTRVPGMNDALQLPGITNAWTMPIRTRIDMLATGIRTPVGVKVMGDDLAKLAEISEKIAAILRTTEGTTSAFAEKSVGGNYLDITIDRDAIARHGLTVGDVQDVIDTALGGMNVTTTVEGLERYPVNLRYPHELRDSPDALRDVLVPTAASGGGAQVPLGQLADIAIHRGPPMVKSENARLTSWVYVDIAGIDVGTYVKQAQRIVADQVALPPGYTIVWSGQYEYMQRARARLMVVVPLAAVLIILLLYMATHSWLRVGIVLLAVPFSLVGAVWLVYLLGYNLSLAVWVGVIALAGLDAETGLVMLLYLDNSYERFKREGRLRNLDDLWHAVHDGAVRRIRPKTMTVMTTFIGLTPLLWAHGAGADTMRRLAAPMIGGLATSFLAELLLYPIIFYLARSVALRRQSPGENSVTAG